jgi:nitrogen PTS system EIIA component
MIPSSRTPEGVPNRCPVCGSSIRIEPSDPPGDAPCPSCGSLLWFAQSVLGDDLAELVQDAIVPDLCATSRFDAIREIVSRLSALGAIDREHEEQIVQSLLKREALGSTAIGDGFAIPHAKHGSIDRLIGAMALSRDGVDFNSIDDRPVHTIFLLLSPIDRPGDHLRALERISGYVRTHRSLP